MELPEVEAVLVIQINWKEIVLEDSNRRDNCDHSMIMSRRGDKVVRNK